MKKIIFLTVIALLLVGCVSLKVSNDKGLLRQQTSGQLQKLQNLNHWDLNGAFSIRTKGHAEIANYAWHQDDVDQYDISIQSSLNLYSVKIEGSSQGVSLWESHQKRITAATPEELLKKRLGWSLPVSNLQYWVRGLPAPGRVNAIKKDHYGHVTMIMQEGWAVEIFNYVDIKDYDLPRVLKISGHGLNIKVVMKQWLL